MRGVVSLAAALAIPVSLDNGSAFPYRNLILFITFVAILPTLVVQGLTLPYIINRWKVFGDFMNEESEELTKREMKRGLKQHVYQYVKEKYEQDLIEHRGMQFFLQQWEEKAKANDDSGMTAKTKAIFQ